MNKNIVLKMKLEVIYPFHHFHIFLSSLQEFIKRVTTLEYLLLDVLLAHNLLLDVLLAHHLSDRSFSYNQSF